MFAQIPERRSRIVHFVGGAYEQYAAIGRAKMLDVRSLPFFPWGFRVFERISAAGDDVCDGVAESLTDVFQSLFAALVFGTVVQERGDRFIFIAAGLHDDARNCKEVRDVWNLCPFARLRGVKGRCIRERIVKPLGHRDR
jgi:hypothetical protein